MTKRLSPNEKRVRGTSRPDRAPKPTAMSRLTKAPPAPEYLSAGARVEWAVLARVTVEIGVLTGADLRALELLSEILATESGLREILKAEGLTIPGAGGNSKAHPACRLLESTRNQAARMLSDFGLSPRGRLGVDVRPTTGSNLFANSGRRPGPGYRDARPWDLP